VVTGTQIAALRRDEIAIGAKALPQDFGIARFSIARDVRHESRLLLCDQACSKPCETAARLKTKATSNPSRDAPSTASGTPMRQKVTGPRDHAPLLAAHRTICNRFPEPPGIRVGKKGLTKRQP
jgi:hypothetical protein